MTTEQVRKFLREDFKFLDKKIEVYERDYCLLFQFRDKMLDNEDRTKTTTVIQEEMVPIGRFKNEHELVYFLWHFILKRIQHEAGELFYIKGKRPFNEHNTDEPTAIINAIYGK